MVFCDECNNFPHTESKRWGDCTQRIFLCDKGIRMPFAIPSSPIDDEWGFIKDRYVSYEKKKPKPIVYGIRGLVPPISR